MKFLFGWKLGFRRILDSRFMRDLAVFTCSAITPPKVNRFGWNLEHSGYIVHVNCGRGSVLLRRQCYNVCTSGFVDDVMFSHNGPMKQNQRQLTLCFTQFAKWRHLGQMSTIAGLLDQSINQFSLYRRTCYNDAIFRVKENRNLMQLDRKTHDRLITKIVSLQWHSNPARTPAGCTEWTQIRHPVITDSLCL